MQIDRSTEGSVILLAPVGDMGLYNLGELRELLQKLRGESKWQVLINMGRVPGIDSISIGFLIQETGLFEEQGGELKLSNLSASVRKSLQVTETLSQLAVYDNAPAALASFRKKQA
jgi:anti-anti-sigma factor